MTATPTPPPTIAEQLRDLLTSGAFVTDATDEEHVAIYLSDNSVLILNAKTDIAWTTSKGGAADTLLTYKRAVAACHSIAEFDVLIKERAELLAQSAQPA